MQLKLIKKGYIKLMWLALSVLLISILHQSLGESAQVQHNHTHYSKAVTRR